MTLLSAVVDWQHRTFLIIPEVFLRIFPNFPNTEAAFEWCSTKVVVLQKRCETMQLLHTCGQKLRKKFVNLVKCSKSSKVASL